MIGEEITIFEEHVEIKIGTKSPINIDTIMAEIL